MAFNKETPSDKEDLHVKYVLVKVGFLLPSLGTVQVLSLA